MAIADDALRVAAVFGEYFTLNPRGESAGLRVSDVRADRARLREWVATTRRVLAQHSGVDAGAVEERVAASIWFLGTAARVVSAPFGAAVLTGVVPRLAADRTWLRRAAPAAVESVAVGADVHTDVVRPVLVPLVDAVAHEFAVSTRVLWGNVASSLAGAAAVVRHARRDLGPRADAVLDTALRGDRLTGTGRRTPAGFRRTSCCLYYRVPGAGICGDCVLRFGSRLPDRPAGKADGMAKHRAEADVEADEERADARDTGGVDDPDKPDQGSTTGTTPDDEYVGRVSGQDVGYSEETGAERRSEDDQ